MSLIQTSLNPFIAHPFNLALDTVEDDTTAFTRPGEKIMYLNAFHETALVNDKWKMVGVGEGDEGEFSHPIQ